MSSNIIDFKRHTESYLDMVFSGRNKAYGAYQLRAHYKQHLKQGLLLCVGVASSFCFYILQFSSTTQVECSKTKPLQAKQVKLSAVKLQKQELPLLQTAPKTTASRTNDFTVPVIVVHQTHIAALPSAQPSVVATPSGIATGAAGANTGTPFGTVPQTILAITPSSTVQPTALPTTVAVVAIADSDPQFPGGYTALNEHLQAQLRHPDELASAEVTVEVEFTIDEYGKLRNVTVLKGMGTQYDEEAVRVINTMPRWKPAIYKGKAVSTHFMIPVKFSLQ